MIRVVLPYHLRTLAGVGSECCSKSTSGHIGLGARRTRDALSVLRGTIRDHVTQSAGHSCGSSPASRICPMSRRSSAARSHHER